MTAYLYAFATVFGMVGLPVIAALCGLRKSRINAERRNR